MAVALVFLLAQHAAPGQTCVESEIHKLVASDAMTMDLFGRRVSREGGVAFVASAGDDDAGSVYVFGFDGTSWVEKQKLIASDTQSGDFFGSDVCISGSVAFVGASFHTPGAQRSGAAYVFQNDGTTWLEVQKLVHPDPETFDQFGHCCVVRGDVALVGAPYHNNVAVNAGAVFAYRFDGSTWVEEQELVASVPEQSAIFGSSVALGGDVALIGASADRNGAVNPGAGYVFRFDGATWVEEQKLVPSDGEHADSFGGSVALHGDWALIGARADDDLGNVSGAAYLFHFDGTSWTEQQKLLASDGREDDFCGDSVALHDELAVVGCLFPFGGPGAAHVYRWNGAGWLEELKLQGSDSVFGDSFGQDVLLHGSEVLAGASGNDDAGNCSGSAYVFSVPDLALQTNRDSIAPGELLRFTTCGGVPGTLALIAAVDLNGTPVFLSIHISTVGANGSLSFAGAVPPGLSGLVAGFQALGFFGPASRLGASNPRIVTFL